RHGLVGAGLGKGDVHLALDDPAEVVDGAGGVHQLYLETLGAQAFLVLVPEAVVDAAWLTGGEDDLAGRRAAHENRARRHEADGEHDAQRPPQGATARLGRPELAYQSASSIVRGNAAPQADARAWPPPAPT